MWRTQAAWPGPSVEQDGVEEVTCLISAGKGQHESEKPEGEARSEQGPGLDMSLPSLSC